MTAPRFSWPLYLEVAEFLLNQKGEHFVRSAISRSYYGVFHGVRKHGEERRGFPFGSGADVHRDVVRILRSQPDESSRELAKDLARLRDERNAADYQIEIEVTPERGREVLDLARSVAGRLSLL